MSLQQSKPWLWIRWIHRQMLALWWRAVDRILGVRTTSRVSAGLRQEYGWFASYRLFKTLSIGPNDVMIDIGCGAGRVVLAASLFPFRHVIGVELLDELHQQAQENLSRMRVDPRARVEFVRVNAAEYRLPDNVTVVFLYNPFEGATFRRVMANVFASVDRAPRRLRLAYANPKEHDYLISTGRCRLVKRFRGLRPTRDWARTLATYIYEVDSRAGRSKMVGEDEGAPLSYRAEHGPYPRGSIGRGRTHIPQPLIRALLPLVAIESRRPPRDFSSDEQ